jgi:hypothetical protein
LAAKKCQGPARRLSASVVAARLEPEPRHEVPHRSSVCQQYARGFNLNFFLAPISSIWSRSHSSKRQHPAARPSSRRSSLSQVHRACSPAVAIAPTGYSSPIARNLYFLCRRDDTPRGPIASL